MLQVGKRKLTRQGVQTHDVPATHFGLQAGGFMRVCGQCERPEYFEDEMDYICLHCREELDATQV